MRPSATLAFLEYTVKKNAIVTIILRVTQKQDCVSVRLDGLAVTVQVLVCQASMVLVVEKGVNVRNFHKSYIFHLNIIITIKINIILRKTSV